MNIIFIFFLLVVGVTVIPAIGALVVIPLAAYLLNLSLYGLDLMIDRIKKVPKEMGEPIPKFRFYKWSVIKRGPKGKASKVCIVVAGILLLVGILFGLLGVLEILPLSSAATAGTLLAIWHIPLVLGLVIGYLPQMEDEGKKTNVTD